MHRLALCLAVVVGALVVAPVALADGPLFVTQGGAGVATQDGGFHYVAVSAGKDATVLEKIEVAGGQVYWWMRLEGSWGNPSVGTTSPTGQGLSGDGRTLVLASTAGPYGSVSKFLVIDLKRAKVLRTITLRGSFTFDAISPDASRIYLIQYTHGGSYDLTHYIVRGYDMRTSRLMPGKIADRSEHEETMAGYAMTRTTSADGRWVYTLYQKPSGEPFVHALDTVDAAAYCIDLPSSPSTNQALYNVVLSLGKGGRTLAVHWRSGRPWLEISAGSWRISYPSSGFPWAWVGAGIGGGLALLAAGGLLLRRRRGEELEKHAGQELGLA
jgi:DNA-binding beta-propeller fold protein YncE